MADAAAVAEAKTVVVGARVREHTGDLKLSGDFLDGLSVKVIEILKAATERAKANGRATLRPYDL